MTRKHTTSRRVLIATGLLLAILLALAAVYVGCIRPHGQDPGPTGPTGPTTGGTSPAAPLALCRLPTAPAPGTPPTPAQQAAPASAAAAPASPIQARGPISCPQCCPEWGCGSNTAQVDGHPLNPVRFQGTDDGKSFLIVPNTFRLPGGVAPVPLTVAGGEFQAGGTGRCDDLRGSRFQIAGTVDGQRATYQVTIVNMGRVKLFPDWQRSDASMPRARFVTAYELGYEKLVDGNPPAPATCLPGICPSAHVWSRGWPEGEQHDTSRDRPVDPDGCQTLSWHDVEVGRFAVIVQGETYNAEQGTVVAHGPGQPWFNVACAGTALAKMRLLGYDPAAVAATDATTPAQRQATLHMITARYCPGDTSFTETGTPLSWQNQASAFSYAPEEIATLEARWTENGATCLSNPRRVTRDKIEAACGHRFPTCEKVAPGSEEWTTYLPTVP